MPVASRPAGFDVLDGDMANSRHRNAVCSAHRLYAAGPRQEPLSRPQRAREHRVLRPAVRASRATSESGASPNCSRAPALRRSRIGRQGSSPAACGRSSGCAARSIHDPDLLILDEPTTGVDPLSRRQFWDLIDRMRARRPGMSVIVATAYMEEAERFDWLIAMDAGRSWPPDLRRNSRRETKATTIEEAFLALLPEPAQGGTTGSSQIPPRRPDDHEAVITARDLTCRFGDFTAVDRVSFTIERGEIFGFLGPNGCGKTTTMKMLTGLLPATAGEAFLLGKPIDAADLDSRKRVGYMSQSFSLYTELTVRQNLELHARLFHLPREQARSRIAELVRRFGLDPYLDQLRLRPAAGHPPAALARRRHRARARDAHPRRADLGRRSAGAGPVLGAAGRSVAQSGRDDLRLDSFHERGRALRPDLADARRAGARDRRAGRGLSRARGVATLEEAFVAYLEEASGAQAPRPGGAHRRCRRNRTVARSNPGRTAARRSRLFSLRRMLAYTTRETLELLRDPIRLSFALLGTAFLMLVFGFGITTDVDNLSFAVLDRDQTPESRAYLERAQRLALFRREAAHRRLRRSRQAPAQRRRQSHDRDPARLRPRHQEAGARPRSAHGSMARCRSAPRRSAAICRACISTTSPIPPFSRQPRAPARRLPRSSRPASATTRISRASTPWCRRPSRCCWC